MGKIARPLQRKSRRDSRINIRLREELHLKLQILADADGRSLSSYIERVLARHVVESKVK
jgi:predicted HicB family RNase H-like nuclease